MRGRRAFVHIFCRAAAAVLLVSPLSAGAQEAPLVVGQSALLSGPQAANGLLYNRGIRLHLDAVNAAGGIGGRKLEMISLDDGYDPERTKANTRQILDDKRVVLRAQHRRPRKQRRRGDHVQRNGEHAESQHLLAHTVQFHIAV